MSNNKQGKKNSSVNYMQYMGMAFQLFLMLGVLIYIGIKVDDYFAFGKSYTTAFLPLLGLIAYFYKMIVDLK